MKKYLLIFTSLFATISPISTTGCVPSLRDYLLLGALSGAGYLGYTYATESSQEEPPAKPTVETDIHFPTTLFSHGITDNFTQVDKYVGRLVGTDAYAVRYYDGSAHRIFKYIKASRSSLGQTHEIETLYQGYQDYVKNIPDDEPLVLMGVSRGAATAVTIFSDARRDLSRVSALILESGYDDPLHMFQHFGAKIGLSNLSDNTLYTVANIAFPSFKRNGETPLQAVKNIPLDLPILLVCLKTDAIVPHHTTIGLYNKLIETGHTNVHLLVFDTGKHSKVIYEKDLGATYTNVVHAFYKKYGLRHNPILAAAGEKDLQATISPTL